KMIQRYVLTGGPGSGKSSIILALEQQGEFVIREAAEDYIRFRQAQGQKEPWTEPDFQDRILDLQIQRESRIPYYAERVFIDRGLADGLAYVAEGTKTYARIKEASKTKYEKIFIIALLDDIEKTAIRRENYEEAKTVEDNLHRIYKELNYEPIRINSGPLEERVQDIKTKIDAMNQEQRTRTHENGIKF
ncbi:MAG: AAA family ATPase, partial [Nanoarchaeota archaeon]|nr:AAA family ATPase [Nanoarchaeota archaeon]